MNSYEASARLVFHFAREESEALGHVAIDPEHLLLGLLRTNSTANRLLLDAGATLSEARRLTRELTVQDAEAHRKNADVSLRTLRVMDRAGREAERLGSKRISTEHILLGILGEDDGAGYGVLQALIKYREGLRQRILEAVAADGAAVELPRAYEGADSWRSNRLWEISYRLVSGRAPKPKTASDCK
jgi:ATP-dependent Clp protease ATP-binding subunit ClpA